MSPQTVLLRTTLTQTIILHLLMKRHSRTRFIAHVIKFSSFSGWVRWDDENTRIDFPNSFGGELPDGIYGENTVIYFCCSTSGRKSAAISMPYKSPFYLIAYGSPRCQRVRYHKASSRISEVHVRDFLGDSCSKS